MMRLLAALVAALALAGCGAATEPSSAERFRGAEGEVAQKVEALEQAGKDREPEEICANILSRQLVREIEAGGAKCDQEMEKAIQDADDFDLEVRDVTISGTQATARVQRGDEGTTTTMEFVREGSQWRATSLSSS
jgi:hypothetical protein